MGKSLRKNLPSFACACLIECCNLYRIELQGHMMERNYLIPIQKGAFSGSKLVTSYLSKKPQEESASETSELLP